MKILSALLSVLLFALAIGYVSLYLDYQNLESEYSFQKNRYEKFMVEQDAKHTGNNSRLVNPYGQMVTKSIASPNATSTANNPGDEFSHLQQENLTRTLDQKYTILFASLKLSKQDQEKMRELLMERERILSASTVGYFTSEADIKDNIEKQQALVATIDQQIARLLTPEDVNKYELLKDSSYEQFQMNSFYKQLGDRNTLDDQKKNTLLLSKLEQKQAFANLLQDSASDITRASAEEKKFFADKMYEALHEYKENYLRTAKANLSEEQFMLLSDYEQKQFDEIWQSLQAGWQIAE